MNKYFKNLNIKSTQKGFVLLVTLVILVVISMLGYTLTSRVSAQRLRNQYLIDYSKARYGCDSALKYTLATLEEIEPQLISRWDKPDFSDLFSLDSAEYIYIFLSYASGERHKTSNYSPDFSHFHRRTQIPNVIKMV